MYQKRSYWKDMLWVLALAVEHRGSQTREKTVSMFYRTKLTWQGWEGPREEMSGQARRTMRTLSRVLDMVVMATLYSRTIKTLLLW